VATKTSQRVGMGGGTGGLFPRHGHSRIGTGECGAGVNFHKSALLAFCKTLPKLLLWLVSGPMGIGVTLLSIPAALAMGQRLNWARKITGRQVIFAAAITGALVLLSVLPAIRVAWCRRGDC